MFGGQTNLVAVFLALGISSMGAVTEADTMNKADRRVASRYLRTLLDESPDVRARAQAAVSLGYLGSDARSVRALRAQSRHADLRVRLAAIAALDRMDSAASRRALSDFEGDQANVVAGALRRAEKPGAVEIRRQSGLYYVALGQPSVSNNGLSAAVSARIRTTLRNHLASIEGVRFAADGETTERARAVLDAQGWVGYFIDSSVLEVKTTRRGTEATVSLMVTTYPDRQMRVLLKGSATAVGGPPSTRSDRAIDGALVGAMRRLKRAFAEAVPTR